MNIDYPAPAQIPALKELWKAAFGDGDDFLTPFFDTAYAPERCRCITIDGRIAAALYWFETHCEGRRFAYVYAVATAPESRNRGLCRALMDDAASVLRELGYQGILLYPASEALSRMYGKMGFEHCTAVTEFRCEAGEDAVPLRKIDKEEYARLRRALLPRGGVIQEGPMLDFFASQASFFTGEGFLAAVSTEGNTLHCHELLGNITAAPGILRALGLQKGFFRCPGTEKTFVMAKYLVPHCTKPAYFGLPLD